jgi:two-component system LytT family response regulator
MKSLIVDDHKINYVLIKNLLRESFPEFEVVDEADSVSSALDRLESANYDLVFLDMQLKDGMGFDILRAMTDFVYVIVISSHPEYALEAFKHNVVDYLVKPFDTAGFRKAVEKVLDLHKRSEALRKTASAGQTDKEKLRNRLLVNYKNKYIAIAEKEVLFIKAQGKYSEIHTVKGERYLSYKNLKEFEDAIPGTLIRIHHSYLVNADYIVSFSREESQIELSGGLELPVSVRKKEELLKSFKVF